MDAFAFNYGDYTFLLGGLWGKWFYGVELGEAVPVEVGLGHHRAPRAEKQIFYAVRAWYLWHKPLWLAIVAVILM